MARTAHGEWERLGRPEDVTVERIGQVMAVLAEINAANAAGTTQTARRTYLSLDARTLRLTDDELRAYNAQIVGRNSRRAGVKALVSKYGAESAERIVSRHAGRHVSIQGY